MIQGINPLIRCFIRHFNQFECGLMIGFNLFAQRIKSLIRCFIRHFNQFECGLAIGLNLFAQRIKFCLEYRPSFFNIWIR